MNFRTRHRWLNGLGGLILTIAFLMPWLWLEIASISGPHLPDLAHEYYDPGSPMMYLSYSVFIVPLAGIYIVVAALFDLYPWPWLPKILGFLVSLAFFGLIVSFSLDESVNVGIGWGSTIAVITALLLLLEEWRWGRKQRNPKT